MKKILSAFALGLALVTSCQEFEPIFADYNAEQPEPYKVWTKSEIGTKYGKFITVAELAKMYVDHVAALPSEKQSDNASRALPIRKPYVLSGRVSTTDQPGNFYKSLYIQDETGGVEIKIGKNGLYNEYKQGQQIYVNLNGLTVGMYGFKTGNYGGNGMVQVGFTDASGEYETAYLENSLLVNTHVLRGDPNDLQVPAAVEVSSSELPSKSDTQYSNHFIGKLVKMKGMQFAKQNFVLLYLDSNKDKKSYTNRIFLSESNGTGECGATHGITTLAMSKAKMTEYIKSGIWDDAYVASGKDTLKIDDPNNPGKKIAANLGHFKGDGTYPKVEKAAYSVSQYFTFSGTSVQLRTSGYCKFADYEIPSEVLSASQSMDVTGVLTMYQGSLQLVVNSAADFVDSSTGKKIYE